MEVPLFNSQCENIGKISLPQLFETKVNTALLYEVVKAYESNLRKGLSSTKTRSEVSGGGRKPWKQKEAGRARAGSIRSPLWRHGGIVFGPKPRSYYINLPKKKKRLALLSALASRKDNTIIIEELLIPEIKTKKAAEVLKKLGLTGFKTLIIVDVLDDKSVKSFRNIPKVIITNYKDMNSYSVLRNEKIIFTKKALEGLDNRCKWSKGAQDNEPV